MAQAVLRRPLGGEPGGRLVFLEVASGGGAAPGRLRVGPCGRDPLRSLAEAAFSKSDPGPGWPERSPVTTLVVPRAPARGPGRLPPSEAVGWAPLVTEMACRVPSLAPALFTRPSPTRSLSPGPPRHQALLCNPPRGRGQSGTPALREVPSRREPGVRTVRVRGLAEVMTWKVPEGVGQSGAQP